MPEAGHGLECQAYSQAGHYRQLVYDLIRDPVNVKYVFLVIYIHYTHINLKNCVLTNIKTLLQVDVKPVVSR